MLLNCVLKVFYFKHVLVQLKKKNSQEKLNLRFHFRVFCFKQSLTYTRLASSSLCRDDFEHPDSRASTSQVQEVEVCTIIPGLWGLGMKPKAL